MSPIRRKGRFVSQDVDRRKTVFSDNFGGVGRKTTSVNKEGVRMIAAKGGGGHLWRFVHFLVC